VWWNGELHADYGITLQAVAIPTCALQPRRGGLGSYTRNTQV
jgi:hypothetical protein